MQQLNVTIQNRTHSTVSVYFSAWEISLPILQVIKEMNQWVQDRGGIVYNYRGGWQMQDSLLTMFLIRWSEIVNVVESKNNAVKPVYPNTVLNY